MIGANKWDCNDLPRFLAATLSILDYQHFRVGLESEICHSIDEYRVRLVYKSAKVNWTVNSEVKSENKTSLLLSKTNVPRQTPTKRVHFFHQTQRRCATCTDLCRSVALMEPRRHCDKCRRWPCWRAVDQRVDTWPLLSCSRRRVLCSPAGWLSCWLTCSIRRHRKCSLCENTITKSFARCLV